MGVGRSIADCREVQRDGVQRKFGPALEGQKAQTSVQLGGKPIPTVLHSKIQKLPF